VPEISSVIKNREVEIVIRPDGSAETSWWTPALAEIMCEVCGKRNSKDCIYCLNNNPWCG